MIPIDSFLGQPMPSTDESEPEYPWVTIPYLISFTEKYIRENGDSPEMYTLSPMQFDNLINDGRTEFVLVVGNHRITCRRGHEE